MISRILSICVAAVAMASCDDSSSADSGFPSKVPETATEGKRVPQASSPVSVEKTKGESKWTSREEAFKDALSLRAKELELRNWNGTKLSEFLAVVRQKFSVGEPLPIERLKEQVTVAGKEVEREQLIRRWGAIFTSSMNKAASDTNICNVSFVKTRISIGRGTLWIEENQRGDFVLSAVNPTESEVKTGSCAGGAFKKGVGCSAVCIYLRETDRKN